MHLASFECSQVSLALQTVSICLGGARVPILEVQPCLTPLKSPKGQPIMQWDAEMGTLLSMT
jgi:hypothetical protein